MHLLEGCSLATRQIQISDLKNYRSARLVPFSCIFFLNFQKLATAALAAASLQVANQKNGHFLLTIANRLYRIESRSPKNRSKGAEFLAHAHTILS
jgi:hypothetical protein